jgi:hypothetical protein
MKLLKIAIDIFLAVFGIVLLYKYNIGDVQFNTGCLFLIMAAK